MNDTTVGFVGLGNVGSKIANNIINNGYKLYVHDLDEIKSQSLVGILPCRVLSCIFEAIITFIIRSIKCIQVYVTVYY